MQELILKLNEIRTSSEVLNTVLLSLLLAAFFFVIRIIINSQINKRKGTKSEKILLKRKFSQYLSYVFMITLLVLWFAKLQVFFVSLLAVAAAIVIAFKELIMCLTGGILLRTSKIFKEGDRIQLDEVRGFVIEKSLLSTKILEIGPEKNSQQTTGDIITIPNSLMLSHTVKNESYFRGYSIKSFVFKIPDVKKADQFESELLSKAEAIVKDYFDEAKHGISKFCEKEGIVIPSMEPRTKVLIDEEEYDILILVKMPIKNDKIADIEQKLNRFYLEWLQASTIQE